MQHLSFTDPAIGEPFTVSFSYEDDTTYVITATASNILGETLVQTLEVKLLNPLLESALSLAMLPESLIIKLNVETFSFILEYNDITIPTDVTVSIKYNDGSANFQEVVDFSTPITDDHMFDAVGTFTFELSVVNEVSELIFMSHDIQVAEEIAIGNMQLQQTDSEEPLQSPYRAPLPADLQFQIPVLSGSDVQLRWIFSDGTLDSHTEGETVGPIDASSSVSINRLFELPGSKV